LFGHMTDPPLDAMGTGGDHEKPKPLKLPLDLPGQDLLFPESIDEKRRLFKDDPNKGLAHALVEGIPGADLLDTLLTAESKGPDGKYHMDDEGLVTQGLTALFDWVHPYKVADSPPDEIDRPDPSLVSGQ